jgi:DNA-binding LytR/AlgR family response regulator
MEKFNCIIVEDEPLAAEVLEDYVKQIPFLDLKATCPDAIYAMEVLQKEKIDVIFLDIHLPKLKGLDFIRTLKHTPQVIITSAYRDYALESYELNVVDYLLKPISFNRFLMAVNKLKQQTVNDILFSAPVTVSNDRMFLFINVNKKRIKVYLNDILYIESKKEYISIVTKDKSYLTKFQLGEIEEHLVKSNFLRVHRSFIVAREKIDAFSATEIEIAGQQVPIGRSYKELVLGQLGETLH